MEKSTSAELLNFLSIAYNLSGAIEAVKLGRFIVLVDVIDMSTTLEAVMEAGAVGVWGACPTGKEVPYYTNPYLIGREAAREAFEKSAQIEIICEPRVGSEEERLKRAQAVLDGLADEGYARPSLWPNLGAETVKFTEWKNKIVIAITDAGGVIYDAVWQLGGGITTATIARVAGLAGVEPGRRGLKRAFSLSGGKPLSLVGASSNAMEDVLAVHYLAQLAMEMGKGTN